MKFNLCLRDCDFRVRVTGNQIPGNCKIFTVGKMHLTSLRRNFKFLSIQMSYGPVTEKGIWRIRTNRELLNCAKIWTKPQTLKENGGNW